MLNVQEKPYSIEEESLPDKNCKFRPLTDHVIVESLEPEVKTAGGLLLPETIKDKPQQGVVVAAH